MFHFLAKFLNLVKGPPIKFFLNRFFSTTMHSQTKFQIVSGWVLTFGLDPLPRELCSHSLLCQWAFYVVRVQSMIARWVSMRIDWLSCGDYRLWMGYDDRRPIKLEEELGCFIKINGLKICASLRIFLENSTCSITQQAHMHILLVKLKRKKITFFL